MASEHEAQGLLALGDALGEVPLDLVVHLVEHLVEVLDPALDDVPALGRGVPEGVAGALLDELLHVLADEELLLHVEVAVDERERREVVDHGAHLLLGYPRVGAEAHHGGPG